MNIIKSIARVFCGHQSEIESLRSIIESIDQLEFYERFQPVSKREVDGKTLREIIRKQFGYDVTYFQGEEHRFLCHPDDIAVFLAQDQTNKFPYISDTKGISSYDCNVFANRLLGQFSVPGWSDLTFGKAWLYVPSHAINCMIDEDEEFWWVEPINDTLLPVDYYDARSVRFVEI